MENCIGIDIAKEKLDVHLLDAQKYFTFENNKCGIAKCLKLCIESEPGLIVFEATGGYERLLAAELMANNLPVARVNPSRIRNYAKSIGRLAKTDKIDAQIIAQYGFLNKPYQLEQSDIKSIELKDLVARRNQLVDMKTAESNRLEHAANEVVLRSVKKSIKCIEGQIDVINKTIKNRIDSVPELKEKARRYKTVPGIGFVTAHMLVSELPELGHRNRREIAMLNGVAPINKDSGKKRGKRSTGGGRKQVRDKLFMPILVAIRHNPPLREFYRRLVEEKGKTKKVAIIATMRKLLCILNAMAKNNEDWRDDMVGF